MQGIIFPFVIQRLTALLNSIAAGAGTVTSPEVPNSNPPFLFHFINSAGWSTKPTELEKALTNKEGLKEGIMNLFLA